MKDFAQLVAERVALLRALAGSDRAKDDARVSMLGALARRAAAWWKTLDPEERAAGLENFIQEAALTQITAEDCGILDD